MAHNNFDRWLVAQPVWKYRTNKKMDQLTHELWDRKEMKGSKKPFHFAESKREFCTAERIKSALTVNGKSLFIFVQNVLSSTGYVCMFLSYLRFSHFGRFQRMHFIYWLLWSLPLPICWSTLLCAPVMVIITRICKRPAAYALINTWKWSSNFKDERKEEHYSAVGKMERLFIRFLSTVITLLLLCFITKEKILLKINQIMHFKMYHFN